MGVTYIQDFNITSTFWSLDEEANGQYDLYRDGYSIPTDHGKYVQVCLVPRLVRSP